MRIEIAVKDYIFKIKAYISIILVCAFFININIGCKSHFSTTEQILRAMQLPMQVLRLIFPQQLDGIAFLMRTCQRSN